MKKLNNIGIESEIYNYNHRIFNLMLCIEKEKVVPVFENGYVGIMFLKK